MSEIDENAAWLAKEIDRLEHRARCALAYYVRGEGDWQDWYRVPSPEERRKRL